MYERTKFTAPSPTRSASSGQSACWSVTITLSTTARSMSGMDDGDERRAQRHAERGVDLPPVAGEEGPEPAEPARRHPFRHAPSLAARRSSRRSSSAVVERGERIRDGTGVVDPGEHVVEPRPHRAFGDGERGGTLGR